MALFLLYLVTNFVYPKGMGYGDVRLSGIIGGILGFISYPAALVGGFAAFLIGGLVGAILLPLRRGSRNAPQAFGPFMMLGSLLAIFASAPIADLYTRLVLPS